MDIYHYDSASGALLGTSAADADPLVPDNWLIPAYATAIVPPKSVAGKVRVFREGAWVYITEEVPPEPEPPVPDSNSVDAERDRRIALGFNWNGKHYQSRQFDLDNIRSMGAAATAMIAQGQVDTGYRWFDADQDFVWIAADNSLTPMSASDMIDFALAAAVWVKNCIFAGMAIKATPGGIPADYAADARWPNASSS